MKKFKVNYIDYGVVKSLILFSEWYIIINDIVARGLNQDSVISIETVLEATSENTTDETL